MRLSFRRGFLVRASFVTLVVSALGIMICRLILFSVCIMREEWVVVEGDTLLPGTILLLRGSIVSIGYGGPGDEFCVVCVFVSVVADLR